jgi:hypothetical protein
MAGSTILVTGRAYDNYGGSGVKLVEVKVGTGNFVAATPSSTAGWSSWLSRVSIPAVTGSYQITAKATDNAGNQASYMITIFTDNIPPSVTIASPAASSIVPAVTLKVSGTASDNRGGGINIVAVKSGAGPYVTATPKAAGDWSTWTTPVSISTPGTLTLTALAIDKAGNYKGTSITLTVSTSKKIFATVLPYVNLSTQSDIYSPHMTATDDSKLHVGLNKGFTDAQLTMVKSLDGIHGVEFFSLAEIQNYAPTLKAKGFDYVSYDLEPGTTYSPQSEVNDPVGSVRKASEIAHANGLLLEVAPSRAITTAYGEQIAPYVDMYHIQSQALQGQPTQFESYVKSMSAKLKAANPNLKSITIQFSTNREAASGMTLQQTMQHDWNLCSDYVDGVTVWFSNNDTSLSVLRTFVDWFDANGR